MKWLNCYRTRLVLIGAVAAIMLCGESAKADFIWTQKADMPTPRWTQTSAVVNGKIYVIGGYPSEGEPGERALSTVEEYDPITNTWTKKTDMPTARCDFVGSSAVVDGKIYVFGGAVYGIGGSDGSTLSIVEEYDPVTDTWKRKADMPTRRCSLATVAVDGKIYAIGGLLSWDNLSGLRTVEEYDPEADTWIRKADMPRGVWGLCASVVSGRIYAMGGRPSAGAMPYAQEYDPSTDTWTLKGDMPVGTSQMGSAVLGNKIVLIGGWYHSGRVPYTTVQIYEPETDIWTIEDDVPFQRAVFSADFVNNRIYAIGGTDRPHPCPATSTVYEFGPLIDFNGDGIVDVVDMCIMVDHWGEDYPLCDIGPTTWGDGIVNVQDLIVLSEHLFEELPLPFNLAAYWKLDEEEGDIAYDSIGDNHGILGGDPTWQPNSGEIAGALKFDGIDDYISTNFVLDPSWGAFSVFAWIKGGAPGQVIISQLDGIGTGEAWLGIDESIGNLVTGLVPSPLGRFKPTPLESEFVITDGQWHHIGFVWDGSYRALYVDGIEVAKDANAFVTLNFSIGGLYIGAGKDLDTTSFFSGLIDDVRIYNQALTAEEIAALVQ